MNIRTTTAGEKKRAKEKKARPDSMHRAVKFLLEQAVMNNRDIKVEAQHHLDTLDAELGDTKEIAKPSGPVQMPAPAAAAAAPPPQEPAQDTAALLRQSRRFKRNS